MDFAAGPFTRLTYAYPARPPARLDLARLPGPMRQEVAYWLHTLAVAGERVNSCALAGWVRVAAAVAAATGISSFTGLGVQEWVAAARRRYHGRHHRLPPPSYQHNHRAAIVRLHAALTLAGQAGQPWWQSPVRDPRHDRRIPVRAHEPLEGQRLNFARVSPAWLREAIRRLAAAGMVPERAGQPVKVWVHIPLAELLAMEGSTTLMKEWVAHVRARWAAHRAEASEGGSDGACWLDGDAAAAAACDAAMAPFVTGEVNPRRPGRTGPAVRPASRLRHGRPDESTDDASGGGTGTGASGQAAPAADTAQAWEAIEQAVIGKAVDLLSGRAGWPASCAAASWASGWAVPACLWTSATPRPSPPGSATP